MEVRCDFIQKNEHHFRYKSLTPLPPILRFRGFLTQKRNSINEKRFLGLVLRKILTVVEITFWYAWATKAIFYYDVFIFGFGRSLFRRNIDIFFLNLLGKKIIMNLGHGGEARPPYLSGSFALYDARSKSGAKNLKNQIRKNRRVVNFALKYCTYVIGSPYNLASFAHSKFINSAYLGIPCDTTGCELPLDGELNPEDPDLLVRILHSPSDPKVKGTHLIETAISNLTSKGYNIEFMKLQNVTNQAVLNALYACDFVIDQVYSDTPMAGFACEAAMFGKPAVVGGYGLEDLKQHYSPGLYPPSVICLPSDIEKSIELLINSKDLRIELGHKARNFIEQNWDYRIVAQKYLDLINGDFPNNWWINPDSVTYIYGASQSIETTSQQIENLIRHYGSQVLGLDRKPRIKQALMELGNSNYVND